MSDLTEKEFASALNSMTEEELFLMMSDLEVLSEKRGEVPVNSDLFSKIVLTESEIERRFPGELLLPYKNWKKRAPI